MFSNNSYVDFSKIFLYDSYSKIGIGTLASRGLEKPFFQLCCCFSFLFWREIGFVLHTTYVLRLPYSCGVVLVFLVLAGNGFWCYLRT